MKSLVAVAAALFAAVVWASAQTPASKTTLDGVYTKDQATKYAEKYVKQCAYCHDPDKVPAGKKPAPLLTGQKFLDKWTDKTLGELITLVATTMPDDASFILTDQEAADSVAYILKLNGMPDGPKALEPGDSSKNIVIAVKKIVRH